MRYLLPPGAAFSENAALSAWGIFGFFPAPPLYDIRIARGSPRAKCRLSSVGCDICHNLPYSLLHGPFRNPAANYFTISSMVETVVNAPPFSEMISLIFGSSK